MAREDTKIPRPRFEKRPVPEQPILSDPESWLISRYSLERVVRVSSTINHPHQFPSWAWDQGGGGGRRSTFSAFEVGTHLIII